jgi:hypothetical protein
MQGVVVIIFLSKKSWSFISSQKRLGKKKIFRRNFLFKFCQKIFETDRQRKLCSIILLAIITGRELMAKFFEAILA